MEIEELKKKEPFWGSWRVENKIGEGSFGCVYQIYREEFGKRHTSALKVISIPKSEDEVKRVMYEGMTETSAGGYFEGLVKDLYGEICMMAELKGKSSIVSYEDHQILPRDSGIGYDILIRMELLTSLNEYVMSKDITVHEVVKLGKDICNALVLCGKRGIIHRDIKPDNIFVSKDGDFKLGDFGIARQMDKNATAMSVKGTYEYMAPEVYKGQEYDQRADIYSLGVVLYTLLNGRRIPFLPTNTEAISYTEKQEALQKRFSGEVLPCPVYAGEQAAEVILKACAFHPEERYQTPKELKKALEAVSYEFAKLPAGINDGLKQMAVSDEERTVDMYSSTVILEPVIESKEKKEKNVLESEKDKLKRQKRIIMALFLPAAAILGVILVNGAIGFIKSQKYEAMLNRVTTVVSNEVENLKEWKETYKQEAEAGVLKEVDGLDSTEQLELNGKNLSDISQLRGAHNLNYLTLSENKELKDISPLKDLTNLQILALDRNKIKDLTPLSKMSNLESLILADNKIEDLSPLENLKKLKYLNISGNNVEDIQVLSNLKSLEILVLTGNPVQEEQLEALKVFLPDCDIIR